MKKWLITFENGYCGCNQEEIVEGGYEDAVCFAEESIDDYAQSWTHIVFGWNEEYTEKEYEDYRADCGYNITPYNESEEEENV